jgi:hypothetical protein
MDRSSIRTLHTLGPSGTNCEAAAWEWARRNDLRLEVELHPTLESAVEKSVHGKYDAVLACIVYPELHSLVFSNLDRIQLVDCFVMPTHRMVLATRGPLRPRTIASHPAPRMLVDRAGLAGARITIVSSNVVAAETCRAEMTEGCVTTHVAAERLGLQIVHDFGPIHMGFSVHAVRN